MVKEENFFKKYIVDPINNSIFGWRQVSKKIGYLEPFDQLIMKTIEDPLLFNWFKHVYDLKIYNSKVIPESGPVIFISNFQSILDLIINPVVIMHKSQRIPKQLVNMDFGIESLLMNFIRMNQAIFIRPEDSDEDAFIKCKKILERKKILICYLEEKINSKNGAILKFKPGIMKMVYEANQSKIPIIPVAIYGSNNILEKNSMKIRFKGILRVNFGNPIENKIGEKTTSQKSEQGLTNYEDLEKFTQNIQNQVNNLCNELKK